MIRHLFKIIWNERKTNGWITLEYILVFCVLWFCIDYLYYMGKSYLEPTGFNVENIYQIDMGKKITEETPDKEALAMTFLNRVKQYPGVESVSFSKYAAPFAGWNYISSYYIDTDTNMVSLRMRWISDGFFDVFKINKPAKGLQGWGTPGSKEVIITPDRNGYFGSYPEAAFPLNEVKKLTSTDKDSTVYTVIGTADKMKDGYFETYSSSMLFPLEKKDFDLSELQIYMRVSPDVSKNFGEEFKRQMRDQLALDPYFLASVISHKDIKKTWTETLNSLKGVYAITTFLFINIFLGIIGTFWYRTQTRRSEIGLRLALGATRNGVKTMIFMETILILFIASIVGVNICVNIGQTVLLETLDIPISNRVQGGIGSEQEFINYALTFGLLAIISLVAAWYPARQAAKIPPAEALRDE
ncbi:FtsX-like permease family protein [uncultured Parabacteroides sp.]|uniref:ABC transporter permease n=1 Tax=uncultured Parabacteroides sp. TaxID=512312 RepID=UPI0025DA078E|nr:FtsX-like permease family protein [uncultured Parabacteroides sp.]